MTNDSENWSAYWQNEGHGGEVFVDERGEGHPALGEFWQTKLANLPAQACVLDLACGGGSIFQHLKNATNYNLYGADISTDAIKILKERMPNVEGVVCPADATSFSSGTFDMVVTQFGVEYAGVEAFAEVSRLVSATGSFVGLCHYHDGMIDARNARDLRNAQSTKESKFIQCAMALTNSRFDAHDGKVDAVSGPALTAYLTAEEKVKQIALLNPHGVDAHLLGGFQQLNNRWEAYARRDIIGWLEGMGLEVEQTINRLSHMRAAALSEKNVAYIETVFKRAGFRTVDIRPFAIEGDKLPTAWSLFAAH